MRRSFTANVPLVLLVLACSSREEPSVDRLDAGVLTDAAPSVTEAGQDGTVPVAPRDAATVDASDGAATRPPVVCGGITCRGVNFVPCCGRGGQCGEFNPFVQKCFEFDAPGPLAFSCPAYQPPQGGLEYPGCCRAQDGLCGHYVAFLTAGRVYSYGCAHPAEFYNRADTETATQACAVDPCPSILLGPVTVDSVVGTRIVGTLPSASRGDGGVQPARRVLADFRATPPLESNFQLNPAPDGGPSSFATCTTCLRVVETDAGTERVYFQETGEARVSQYLATSDGGPARISQMRTKLQARLVEHTTDVNGDPVAPKPGGKCLYLHGYLDVNGN